MVDEPGGVLQARLRALGQDAAAQVDRTTVVARRVVYGGAAVYALVFAATAVAYYLSFQEARLDLGNMVQAIWSTSHGHLLESTDVTGQQMSRLGGHVEPFLVLLVPLWWIWSSPIALLVLQAVGLASGALPVYWLARKHLGDGRPAAHFAFAYLLYPATQYNAFTLGPGFHAVSLAVPLILYAIWFLDEGRLVPFAIVAVLAATTKEEIPLAVGCLGIWYAVRTGRRIVGGAIFGLGAVAFLVNFLIVIPHFAVNGENPFASRYAQVGGTPQGVVRKLFTDPLAFVHTIATWHKLIFLVLVLVPFLGLWLLEPLLFLGAVPDLVINILSSKPEQTTIQFHYTAGVIPFLVAASILGAAKLRRDPDRVSFYALAGAACIALYSPLYFAGSAVRDIVTGDPVVAAKAHALDLVPAGVPIAASNQLGGYLSDRRRILVFPYVRESRWVVIDAHDSTYDPASYHREIARIDRSPEWTPVFSSHGVQVLRRR